MTNLFQKWKQFWIFFWLILPHISQYCIKFKCFSLDFKVSKFHFAAANDNLSAAGLNLWELYMIRWPASRPDKSLFSADKNTPWKIHLSRSCGTTKMHMILDYYQYLICPFFLFSYSSCPRHVYPLTTWSKRKSVSVSFSHNPLNEIRQWMCILEGFALT